MGECFRPLPKRGANFQNAGALTQCVSRTGQRLNSKKLYAPSQKFSNKGKHEESIWLQNDRGSHRHHLTRSSCPVAINGEDLKGLQVTKSKGNPMSKYPCQGEGKFKNIPTVHRTRQVNRYPGAQTRENILEKDIIVKVTLRQKRLVLPERSQRVNPTSTTQLRWSFI